MPTPYPEVEAPTKTPVRLPRSDCGSMPARSRTSQDASRSRRCCGSMATASRGEMPNSPASKVVASWTKPPSGVYSPSAAVRSQPRSVGKPAMPSAPVATRSHRSSAERTPPG